MLLVKYINNKKENVELKIMDTYEITKSSQELTYSDLTCDFTNYGVDDLPEKYQEVKVVDRINNYDNIKYFGYIDSYSFGEMRETDNYTDINLTLLSPVKLTTLRTFIALGTYQLIDLLQNIILAPLINDGFTIKEINITDRTLTTNYLSETIEYGLSDLSNKYNFWWFIDENKNIYIKDIETMLNNEPKYIYDDTHVIKGLQYLKPTIMSDNYANVINFKNVRIYEYSDWEYSNGQVSTNINGLLNGQISTLKKDGQIIFNYPVDIKKENIQKSGESYSKKNIYYGIRVFGTYSNNTTFEFYVKYDVENNLYSMSSNLGFDGNEETTKEFLLIRDSFFSNLITGFKYNSDTKNITSLSIVMSDSALVWNINKFYNDKAINEKKGIINDTGIVELIINMNEQWKTRQELQEIGISYMNKNSLKLDGSIEIKTDEDILTVGDIIKINKMLFNSKYIVTKVRESYNNGSMDYYITCKDSNITDNYIDLFRSSTTQEAEEKNYQINISHYNEEGIKETFEVVK